jgi:N-acylneuraminate cytidylyltransferase
VKAPQGAAKIPPVAALVPLKAHSERVPGKNTRPFCGKPLFHWILETLQGARHVQRLVIDTDSEALASQASASFDVHTLNRPPHLLGDHIVADELIAYDIQQLPKFDYFLQTHATNPLLKSSTVDAALEVFFSQSDHDSLFSVSAVRSRFFFANGSPVHHDPDLLIPTQELDPLYEENSCIYIFSRQSFEQRSNRLGANPLMFPIAAREAVDIDEEIDFAFAQVLMQERLADSSS